MQESLRRIGILAWTEVLHLVRDKASLAQALMVPVIQLLVLANAATFKIKDTPLYVVDHDRSSESRALVDRFQASGNFNVVGYSASPESANEELLQGRATMILTIPEAFDRSLVTARMAEVQLTINAEKGSAAGIARSYAVSILRRHAGTRATIDVRTSNWYNPQLNYKHYMVPALLVSLVTIISTLLAAQNIARERELGTLEQLNVTPIARGEFIIAKLLPFWVIALIDLTIALLIGRFVFGMPVRGSLLLLYFGAGIYLLTTLGIGLWVSARVETQQQAMFVSFFILMIYLLMSGLFTPIDSMPLWVQKVAMLNPVRHFVEVSRAILMKGAGLREVARPLLILIGFAVVVLTMATRQYAKRTA